MASEQKEINLEQNDKQTQQGNERPRREGDEQEDKRKRKNSRSSSGSRSPRSRSPKNRSRSPKNRSRSPPNRNNPPPSNCLGVFGLSSQTTEQDLQNEFSRFGECKKIDLIYDKQTQRSRGFGFIYFASVEEATRAKEACNGMKLHGKNIRTDFSTTNAPHDPTPGEYKGRRRTHRGDRYNPRYNARERYDDRYYDDRERGYYRSRDRYDDRYYDDRDRYERGRYHHDERDSYARDYYRRDHY